MSITVADLNFFKSERMTDYSDGGGRMTANAIVFGVENQIFDDVSDVDRAAGDVSIRKVYAAVTSANTDKYLDSGIVVFKEPDDPAASVLAFSTDSFYDERADLQNRLEQTVSRGPRFNGYLFGQHLIGQRALLIWQRKEANPVSTGQRIEVIAKSGTVEQYSQFVWITRIFSEIRTGYDNSGAYSVRVLTCELAEPLLYNFDGIEPARYDPAFNSIDAVLHETRYNANAVPLFGVVPTAESATTGDFTIKVSSVYSPVIPTAFIETPLIDVSPNGDIAVLALGNNATISFTTSTATIKPGIGLYLGTGVYPGTLAISVSGTTITDSAGIVKSGTLDIGEIDYGNGIIFWNDTCPNYSTALKQISFKPASRLAQFSESGAQLVTQANNGFVWVYTASPIPMPGTLRVSYRALNSWYVLTDKGDGLLTGVDSSYGSGRVDFNTGSIYINTGALPDIDSEIIYNCGTPSVYTARGGSPIDGVVISGVTANSGVAPGTVTISWMDGSTNYSVSDEGETDGNLVGTGGVGFIRYVTGEWSLRPTNIPPAGTEFDITYSWGEPYEDIFDSPALQSDETLLLPLTRGGIVPHSVYITYDVTVGLDEVPFSTTNPEITYQSKGYATDDGSGAIDNVNPYATQGTINYSTGQVRFNPSFPSTIRKPLYETYTTGAF